MKKYLISALCAGLCCLAISVFANTVNDKVLKSFKETFPNAQNVNWQSSAEKYVAQFQQNGIRTIVNYDFDGNILEATRYYTEENLPINIVWKLKKKYPSAKIYGVTEVTTNETINFYIKLEGETTWTTVKTDTEGNAEMVEKYNKQM
ncbi:MAG TPA: hypothetical protein VKR53_12200 [Puia sp.]|nr:hypothetical protein [Puia sp.]